MSQQPHKHRTAYSAGGVCYRWADNIPEVVLIATVGGTRWGLPKGQPEDDETPAEAARRELAEETGIFGEVLQPLSLIDYWFRAGSARIHKSVEFFLLRFSGGNLSPQLSEVDDVRWVALPEALRIISFPRERAVLERVWKLWHDNHLH
ncbi:MAG: NUDIX hydrolase [Herpetosiphonaceae bacterium]|nr:NUDIX hydrolase [Herpetosiphonaceae bacterium]